MAKKKTKKKVSKRVSIKAKPSSIKGIQKGTDLSGYASVYVLCQDREEALKIAQTLVEENLVACFNLFENVTSVYKWQGELEKSTEVAMIGKTRMEHRSRVQKRVKELHSYQIPCIVFWPIVDGLPSYFDWILNSCP